MPPSLLEQHLNSQPAPVRAGGSPKQTARGNAKGKDE